MSISEEEKLRAIKEEVDFAIVGDNISDLAEFTVEKFEFKRETSLSSETREEGIARIKEVLWKQVEILKRRRIQFLAEMFALSERALEEVVSKGK